LVNVSGTLLLMFTALDKRDRKFTDIVHTEKLLRLELSRE